MRIQWEIDTEDVRRVKALLEAHKDDALVRDRIELNVERHGLDLSREVVWAEIVGCLVSTQQRWQVAERFCELRPFPLSYSACIQSRNVAQMAEETLRAGGLRRWSLVAREVAENLVNLESGLWKDLLAVMEDLRDLADSARERSAADFVDDQLTGFGPKQARNLLQGLGLTRYEIPIDSRVVRWLTSFQFPVPVSASCLSDRPYYHFLSDAVQHLCAACGVHPCILDAAVFASFERQQSSV